MPYHTDQKCKKDLENLSKIYGQVLKRLVITIVLRLVEKGTSTYTEKRNTAKGSNHEVQSELELCNNFDSAKIGYLMMGTLCVINYVI